MRNNHCKPLLPPPPPPLPPRNSYTFCCCGEEVVNVPSPKFPTSGPFKGSAFVLNDAKPYLFDTTYTSYGPILCFSEHIYTNITQRNSVSCIDLAATFDMVDTNLPNNVRLDMVEKSIGNNYLILNGVLPIIKRDIKFKIIYTITDSTDGIVYTGECCSTSLDNSFHFTDIKDRFVMSARNIVIDVIPQLPTNDVYTITIDRVEAFVNVIDVGSHIIDDTNTFYKFTNNNMSIIMNSDVITSQAPDEEIMIAYCDVKRSFMFNSSISTRLRITFTAYMSPLIATGDTSNIYNELTSPTEEILDMAIDRITQLEDKVKMLEEMIDRQNCLIQKLSEQIRTNGDNIIQQGNQINNLNNTIQSLNEKNDEYEARITRLEEIPLATLSYNADTQFVKGQLTWTEYGKLYQATTNFVADGLITNDIDARRLVPVE